MACGGKGGREGGDEGEKEILSWHSLWQMRRKGQKKGEWEIGGEGGREGRTCRSGVLVEVTVNGGVGSLCDEGRRVPIRKALAEIDHLLGRQRRGQCTEFYPYLDEEGEREGGKEGGRERGREGGCWLVVAWESRGGRVWDGEREERGEEEEKRGGAHRGSVVGFS